VGAGTGRPPWPLHRPALGRKFVRLSWAGCGTKPRSGVTAAPTWGPCPAASSSPSAGPGPITRCLSWTSGQDPAPTFGATPPRPSWRSWTAEQNSTFSDHYLEVDFDLSKVMFITPPTSGPHPAGAAGSYGGPGITGTPRGEAGDRLPVTSCPAVGGSRLTTEQMEVAPEAVRRVISSYTREAGLRNLEREIRGTVPGRGP